MTSTLTTELMGYLSLIDGSTTLGTTPCLSTDIETPDTRTDTAPLSYCRNVAQTRKETKRLFSFGSLPQESDAFLVYSKRLDSYVRQSLTSQRKGTQQSVLWALAVYAAWEKVQWLQEAEKLKHPKIKPDALHLTATEISRAAEGLAVVPLSLVEEMLAEQFEQYWPRSKDFFIAYARMKPSDPRAEVIAEWRCRRFTEAGVISTLAKTFVERTGQHASLVFLSTCAHIVLGKVTQ